jgi:hypothetical protein
LIKDFAKEVLESKWNKLVFVRSSSFRGIGSCGRDCAVPLGWQTLEA